MAQRSLPNSRRDTPSPGWQTGVWVRIQRRRRTHRVAATALALTAAGVCAVLARARREVPAPVEIRVELGSLPRADGSAPMHARWQIRYVGAELRVYRNALGAVLRCPGGAECAVTSAGGAVSLVLDGPGEYRAVAFSRPLGASGATMQEDLAGARARGDPVEISSSLVVY